MQSRYRIAKKFAKSGHLDTIVSLMQFTSDELYFLCYLKIIAPLFLEEFLFYHILHKIQKTDSLKI